MLKWLSILMLSIALLGAGGAAFYVMETRDKMSRRQLAVAESREEAAKSAERQALSEEKKAEAERLRAEADKKRKEAEVEAKRLEENTTKEQAKKAEADRRAAEERRKALEAEAKAKDAERESAKQKAKEAAAEEAKARAKANEAEALAQAEEAKKERERAVADALIAERELWALKEKNLVELEQELLEFKKELDEREFALRPEKTIMDLANIGNGDDESVAEAMTILPENDPALPKADRKLFRAQRLKSEQEEAIFAKSKELAIAKIEKLYVEALKKNDISLADYYRENLKALYPDWEFKGEKVD